MNSIRYKKSDNLHIPPNKFENLAENGSNVATTTTTNVTTSTGLTPSSTLPIPSSQLVSYIFPDIRALYYLNLHLFSNLCFCETEVPGFEIYIVEQWVADRKLSSLITSYTGNSQDVIKAVQVLLPSDPELWPGSLKLYYEELLQFSQPKVTSRGALFVTNLFSVPSVLNLLHVECGDLRAIWDDFKANFDLKKLHCGGRSALLLNAPSTAAEEKFSQLYKIPIDNPNFNNSNCSQLTSDISDTHFGSKQSYKPYSVVELVTLVQISLSYFHLFKNNDPKDGILCNDTKRAIDDWWNQYGKLYLGMEKPRNESTMGPTTVSAIISLVLSCYCKLVVTDCISSKDPFDEDDFYIGIHNFQKKYGLAKNNSITYLDHQTIEKLCEISAKTSNSDIFKFKKVVSTTVQDLRGKGNRAKFTNEILTTDIDNLVKHINDGALGILWKGSGKRSRNSCRIKAYGEGIVNLKFENGNPTKILEKQDQKILQRKLQESERKQQQQRKLSEKMESDNHNNNHSSNNNGNSNNVLYSETDEDESEEYDDLSLGGKQNKASISSVSASSMYCNYNKTKYQQNYDTNRIYRGEYHRRNSIPFISDGTKNPREDIFNYPHNVTENELYRCSSMSKIQDVVEQWKLPFDPSLIRMARDLLKIKNQLEINQEEESGGLYIPVENSTEYFEQNEEIQFIEVKKKLQENYQKYAHNAKIFRARHEDVENRKELVLSKMHELDSLSSKLKYNIRVLDRRIRDVEDSIRQFDSKLKSVKDSFSSKCICPSLVSDPITNKTEFENYVKHFMDEERARYQCMVIKCLHRLKVKEFENTINVWVSWIFNKVLHRNHSIIEDKKVI
ncbi:hypothetical protein TBLA_0A10560 [Henningerozyma blattae CBS 6284]|uniref:STB6-like N-terminal domain-containing protein n=1 Tax=Henningerozyma blattae (strain ATCC 34711 / CBS 6284 / DSM 70876 / NBRC 10599 / NRRL Y-10934 / UCD 77-7) TaxID=1071380 RepID=I2GXI2_HENB6|nr:hypothetical protein TBLA_0A10560 [Tetrapisispora blattae CBS 6284]CCH58834.1 hypothetical protein TBLA_0A10560 [Tetrapisispora blattae CBS 6284]